MGTEHPRTSEQGVSLTEIMIAFILLSIGILALSGVMVSVNREREANQLRYQCLKRAQSVLEEIRGQPSETIVATYQGASYPVSGVTGYQADRVLSVAIDDTDPGLLVVTINGNWHSPSGTETLALRSEILNVEGM